MQCPQCLSEVPPGPICLQCGGPLAATAGASSATAGPLVGAAPAAAQPLAVPLRFGQKARLLGRLVPPILFALVLFAYLTLLDDLFGIPPTTPPLFFLLNGAVLLLFVYRAVQGLRDALSGVALVREDRLERVMRGRGTNRHPYARFAQLGLMRLTGSAGVQAIPGQRYRVSYSPGSKLVWSLEPLRPF